MSSLKKQGTLFFSFFYLKMSTLLKNVIPKTGQIVSRLGFGSYRVNQAKHAEALTTALEQGINIIDTANNFERGNCFTIRTIHNNLVYMQVKLKN
jgi:predicted aldo/keto reductase-like oxidoreductase